MPQSDTPQLNPHHKDEFHPAHTAEHIINRTMDNIFHCGRSVEAHIERKKSKLDYAMPLPPTPDQLAQVEQLVNEVIDQHLDISFSYITQQQAATEFDLNRLPDDASQTLRVVSIGNYDRCLCIGQHVANSSQIGHVKFLSHDYDTQRHILRLRFKIIP